MPQGREHRFHDLESAALRASVEDGVVPDHPRGVTRHDDISRDVLAHDRPGPDDHIFATQNPRFIKPMCFLSS